MQRLLSLIPEYSKWCLLAISNLLETVRAVQAGTHAEQLSALGHPARLAILPFVVQSAQGGAAAGEIQLHLDMAASKLSPQLKSHIFCAPECDNCCSEAL